MRTILPMKRKFAVCFILPLFLFYVPALHAQNPNGPSRFRAGLSFGAVATDIPGLDQKDNDSDFHKLGLSFGGIVSTYLSSKNTLQLEINYIQKGSASPPDSGNLNSYKFALQYIEVPIVFKHKLHINIRRKPADRLEIEGGVSFGRLIKFTNTDESNSPIAVNENLLNATDVSLLGGLSFDLTPNISFCIRYSNSVIPVIKRNTIPTYQLINAFNMGNNEVVFMGVKYVFGKAKASVNKENPPPANP
jgi:hypothetical protein